MTSLWVLVGNLAQNNCPKKLPKKRLSQWPLCGCFWVTLPKKIAQKNCPKKDPPKRTKIAPQKTLEAQKHHVILVSRSLKIMAPKTDTEIQPWFWSYTMAYPNLGIPNALNKPWRQKSLSHLPLCGCWWVTLEQVDPQPQEVFAAQILHFWHCLNTAQLAVAVQIGTGPLQLVRHRWLSGKLHHLYGLIELSV